MTERERWEHLLIEMCGFFKHDLDKLSNSEVEKLFNKHYTLNFTYDFGFFNE